MTAIRIKSVVTFLATAAAIITICFLIIRSGYFYAKPDAFAMAITVDVALFIPLIYFLAIRKKDIPKVTVIPVLIFFYVVANALLPADRHNYLELIKKLFVPMELFVTGFIIYKVRTTTARYNELLEGHADFIVNLRESLYSTLGKNRAADIFATEMAVFYYGLCGWGRSRETGQSHAFTYHKRVGYGAIVGVFCFLIILETIFLHLLISRWSILIAWILSVLSVYSLLFLFGDYNASRKRPVLVDDKYIYFRTGLRWFVTIPLEHILSIRQGIAMKGEEKDLLKMVLTGSENIVITLKQPATASGLYGISKNFNTISLSIDDRDAFCALLQKLIGKNEKEKFQ